MTKYAVTALTVKCIDQATGEEIYFKTVLPKGTGSWATEEEALTAIGGRIADEFSRDFFLQHMYATGQRVSLVVNGLPDANAAELVGRELVSLPAVIAARRRAGANPPAWDLQAGRQRRSGRPRREWCRLAAEREARSGLPGARSDLPATKCSSRSTSDATTRP